MSIKRTTYHLLAAGSLMLASMLFTAGASAAPVVTYSFDFTAGGTESSVGNPGNTWTYLDSTGTKQVQITSWAELSGNLQTATGHQMTSAGGLGVCNADELPLAGCEADEKTRSIDNAQGQDWVLLLFAETMDLNNFLLAADPPNKGKVKGLDVTYFTGWVDSASDLNGLSYADLAAPESAGGQALTRYDVNNGKVAGATVDINGEAGGVPVWGNAILIGASLANGGDRLVLTGATTTVPIPAAAWMFLSALGALGARHRLFRKNG